MGLGEDKFFIESIQNIYNYLWIKTEGVGVFWIGNINWAVQPSRPMGVIGCLSGRCSVEFYLLAASSAQSH